MKIAFAHHRPMQIILVAFLLARADAFQIRTINSGVQQVVETTTAHSSKATANKSSSSSHLLLFAQPSSQGSTSAAADNPKKKGDQKEGGEHRPEFSHSLSQRQERDFIQKEYAPLYDEGPAWRRQLLRSIKAIHRAIFPSRAPKPGTLIMIKGGESE
jgi:hypothetical protein